MPAKSGGAPRFGTMPYSALDAQANTTATASSSVQHPTPSKGIVASLASNIPPRTMSAPPQMGNERPGTASGAPGRQPQQQQQQAMPQTQPQAQNQGPNVPMQQHLSNLNHPNQYQNQQYPPQAQLQHQMNQGQQQQQPTPITNKPPVSGIKSYSQTQSTGPMAAPVSSSATSSASSSSGQPSSAVPMPHQHAQPQYGMNQFGHPQNMAQAPYGYGQQPQGHHGQHYAQSYGQYPQQGYNPKYAKGQPVSSIFFPV